MKLHLSRALTVLAGQAGLNVLLASWLYNEYVHNRFMQEYVAEFWTTNAVPVALSLVAAGVIFGGSFMAFLRIQAKDHVATFSEQEQVEQTAKLSALDVCPFCNTSLVSLSDSRFHCRNCHRYFKK